METAHGTEVTELAAALARHPAVTATLVTRDADGTLSARVTLDRARAPGVDRLLRLLELPEPARPTIVELEPGLPVCVRDETEARSRYREIAEQGDFPLPDGACVLDVGAHIGLGVLADLLVAPGVRLFAVEPDPELFELLRKNVRLYDVDAVLLPDPVASVSRIIEEEGIDRVALLRTDRPDVIAAIDDRHWPRIDAVRVTVPVPKSVRTVLIGHGFDVRADGRHLLTATRPGTAVTLDARRVARRLVSLPALVEEIRTHAAARPLGELVPVTVTAVSELPAAAVPDRAVSGTEDAIGAMMAKIIGIPAMASGDNFFGVGGTSLRAVKLTAAICRRFTVSCTFRMVVDNPTPAALARVVDDLVDT
jgi:hypothetical protein